MQELQGMQAPRPLQAGAAGGTRPERAVVPSAADRRREFGSRPPRRDSRDSDSYQRDNERRPRPSTGQRDASSRPRRDLPARDDPRRDFDDRSAATSAVQEDDYWGTQGSQRAATARAASTSQPARQEEKAGPSDQPAYRHTFFVTCHPGLEQASPRNHGCTRGSLSFAYSLFCTRRSQCLAGSECQPQGVESHRRVTAVSCRLWQMS